MERRALNAAIQSMNAMTVMNALQYHRGMPYHMYQGYDVFLDGLPINVFSVARLPKQNACVVNYSAQGSRWGYYSFAQLDATTPPTGIVLKPKTGPNARKLRNRAKRYLARQH